MKLIKRYKNRRLYDTESSRTITHADLARMIRAGQEVKVIDSASGDDITVQVLGRLVVWQAERWPDVSEAKEYLSNLICTGGDKAMSILKNTVLAGIGIVQVTRAKAEEVIDDLIKRGELDKSKRKEAVMELVDKAEKTTDQIRQKVLAEADKAQKSVTKLTKEFKGVRAADLQRLEDKVDELAKAIKDMKAKE